MPDKIHNRIKNRRIELGLSQDILAKTCGVGQSTVANWERGGHIPRPAKINKIAKALNIEEVWLITGEHPTNEGPINQYLNTPIRHIPVFNWPSSKPAFDSEKPIGYVTMTIGPKNVFSLLAPKNGTEFKHNTLLMFTRDYNSSETGIFLSLTNTDFTLKTANTPPSDCEGRLIFSQTAH